MIIWLLLPLYFIPNPFNSNSKQKTNQYIEVSGDLVDRSVDSIIFIGFKYFSTKIN